MDALVLSQFIYLKLKGVVPASSEKKDAVYLYENGAEETALECSAVWDTVTEAIDALHEAINGRSITAARFCELLKIHPGDESRSSDI